MSHLFANMFAMMTYFYSDNMSVLCSQVILLPLSDLTWFNTDLKVGDTILVLIQA